MSVHSSGRVTTSAGIPGSGVSYVKTHRLGAAAVATSRQSPTYQPATPAKPGMFAPKWEKDLYKALSTNDPAQFLSIGSSAGDARQTCMWLEVLTSALPGQDLKRAREIVEILWAEGYDPALDQFLSKYLPGRTLGLGIAAEVFAELPISRDALGLLLAELRQAQGDAQGAIDVVEQVTPSTVAAVSLAELYAETSRWADVVALTDGLLNEDDFATYLLVQRGVALRELGHFDASREAFKAALAPRSRPTAMRHLAMVERGQTYLAEGKKAMARKDFERVLADDATYPGLSEHLARVARDS